MGKYRWSVRKWVEKEQGKTGITYLVTDMSKKEIYCFRTESFLLSIKNDEIHMLPNWGYPKAFAVNFLLANVRAYCDNLYTPKYDEVEEMIADWAKDAVWRRIK